MAEVIYPITDYLGKTFGRLFVERLATDAEVDALGWKRRQKCFFCRCSCGKTKVVQAAGVRREVIRSCGCLRRERSAAAARANADKTRLDPEVRRQRKRAYDRSYYEDNREKIIANVAAYQRANRDKTNERNRHYTQRNPDRVRECKRRSAEKHPRTPEQNRLKAHKKKIKELANSVFYIIQLAPDLKPGRVKLGFTSVVAERLAEHQVSAPTAVLYHTWPCHRSWEKAAIASLTRAGCTMLRNESFDCDNLEDMVARGDAFFALMPPLVS